MNGLFEKNKDRPIKKTIANKSNLFPSLPPRVTLAQLPTPLHSLDRLSRSIGGPRIWVKRDDLSGSTLSGNKVRKLEFLLAAALANGCDTVITGGGIQSNHCRATALAAKQCGLHAHLLLRGKPTQCPEGNLLLDYLAGAQVTFCDENTDYDRLHDLMAEQREYYRQLGHNPWVIPIGGSDRCGLWGYIAACAELAEDCAVAGIAPSHIICATGSGGTQGGLILGCQYYGINARVLGVNVCDDARWFEQKIRGDLCAWQQHYQAHIKVNDLPIEILDGYVGAGYALASEHVWDTIIRVARSEGIVLDPVYTGKAFDAVLCEIKKGYFAESSDIIFISTGGIFGLLAQRPALYTRPHFSKY